MAVTYLTCEHITESVDAFLSACKYRDLSVNTVNFYRLHLLEFLRYNRAIYAICDITPVLIRNHIAELHRNPGGKHGAFRAIRTWLNWHWAEYEPDYPNPILKVKFPPPKQQPINGIPMQHIRRMLEACTGFYARRDTAIILFLLDTGVRASEACNLNIGDVNLITGAVQVRSGKGGYSRTVYIGDRTRRKLRLYLKNVKRIELYNSTPLFLSHDYERFTRFGLRSILKRRAAQAGVPCPGLHDFRRTFAVTMLRNGVDLLTISRLLGHHSLSVTERYLAQTAEDIQTAHRYGSPVDRAL